jgi:hypothetical protein
MIVSLFIIGMITGSLYNAFGEKWEFEYWLSKHKIRKDWGVKFNIPYMVEFRQGQEYIRKSIYGMNGVIEEVESDYGKYVVVRVWDKNVIDKEITFRWDWIKKNPDFLVLSHQKLGKKLIIKKGRPNMGMPRIFKFFMYLGIVNLFWQFVNNAQNIVTFVVGQFIK